MDKHRGKQERAPTKEMQGFAGVLRALTKWRSHPAMMQCLLAAEGILEGAEEHPWDLQGGIAEGGGLRGTGL